MEEKKKRMEKVVQNREKRQNKSSDDINPPSVSAVSVASPPSTPGPVSPQTIAAAQILLQPESTNLLSISRMVGGANELPSSSASATAAMMDAMLVRRLTAEETQMLHELNQVYGKYVV